MLCSVPLMATPVLDALNGGDLYIAVQPIVDLVKRDIFGYEGLLRCRSGTWKSPPQCLQAAADEGSLGALGRGLRELCTLATPAHCLFVNVNPAEFDEGWLVRPDDPMFSHDRDIYVEVTESVPLSHFRMCHTILHEMRSRGVFLAVDDLGAGYSNLKYIADLKPEIVKLDRSLIAGVTAKSRLDRLLCSLVRLCHDMGARVVCEGIETEEEFRAVLAAGADFAQGYFLARPAYPAPPVDFASLPR